MSEQTPPPSPEPPPAQATPPPAETPAGSMPPNEEKNWCTAAHLSALSGFIIPFGNILGPLIIWLMKRDESATVAAHGKEALNFQITVTIAMIVSAILIVLVIGLLMMAIVGIGALVLTIIGGVKAADGELYRYPMTLRLVN